MIANIQHRSTYERGFTLIEVMVALVVGIISMVVVLQTFSASENTKRTATGGDDAQMAGALGLFQIERDLNQAGYGISAPGLLNCSLTLTAAGGSKVITLAPITINPATTLVPAGDANTDTLLITYGNSLGPTEGDLIDQQISTTVYAMQSASGWSKNDYVAVVQKPPTSITPTMTPTCSGAKIDKITALPTSGNANVTVASGVAGLAANSYILYDMGQAPVIVAYRVFNGSLTSCNYMAADCSNASNYSEVSGNISSLRAVYGHDGNAGNMNGVVDTWDQTTPSTVCGWIRTSAVSVVLAARNNALVTTAANSNNGTFSGTAVTTSSPVWQEPIWSAGTLTWAGSTATSVSIDLSGNVGLPSGTTWQNYRYKLYPTVVPLRNITSMGVVSTCN